MCYTAFTYLSSLINQELNCEEEEPEAQLAVATTVGFLVTDTSLKVCISCPKEGGLIAFCCISKYVCGCYYNLYSSLCYSTQHVPYSLNIGLFLSNCLLSSSLSVKFLTLSLQCVHVLYAGHRKHLHICQVCTSIAILCAFTNFTFSGSVSLPPMPNSWQKWKYRCMKECGTSLKKTFREYLKG